MVNNFTFILLLLISISHYSCSPENKNDDIVPPTIVDSTSKDNNISTTPKFEITKKPVIVELSNFKIDFKNAEDFYLGSVWSLDDTTNGFQVTHFPNKEKSDKIYFLSNNTSVDLESFLPSYQNMLSYAEKFKSGSSNLSFNSGVFFDYGTIQNYLGNSGDYKVVKDLVSVNDSTFIRKKNGISRYSLKEYLFLFTDIVELNTLYDQNYLRKLQEENLNPYCISSVTYGAESIFLAESDSSRSAFNKAFDKLIDNSALDNSDIAVLNASNLLIYHRDSGSNSSFIKFGKGATQIGSFINEFIALHNQNANAVNFPLSFTMNKMSDMSTLNYKLKFDILEKVEQ